MTDTLANTVLRARVTGRVQGVWFRGWTKEIADRLGLRGWVKNEADGSVCVLIAGPKDAVAEMVEALHHGPEAARVATVETEFAEADVPDGFEVRR